MMMMSTASTGHNGEPKQFRCFSITGVVAVILASIMSSEGKAAAAPNWVASWAAPMQSSFVAPTTPQWPAVSAYEPQPDLSFALPDATTTGAVNQTFRTIVKPDLLGPLARIRLSNVFGTHPVVFSAASIAVQAYQANIVPGSAVRVTFNGAKSVQIAAGSSVFSDPVPLPFVALTDDGTGSSARNLAVSFAVSGSTGPATFHMDAFTTNYISPPNSGDMTLAEDDTAFPFSTTSDFFLSEVDVAASPGTFAVVAFGDSLTDGTFSTLNGNDRWLNVMSRELHRRFGSRVSVVNAAISGNAVVNTLLGQPAVARVGRDVIGLSGAKLAVLFEGTNDLGFFGATAAQVEGGYQTVVAALHAADIKVIGATLTPSLAPGGIVPANSPLPGLLGPAAASNYGNFQTDAVRQQINSFILTSGLYDGTADFSAAVRDPDTGTLKAPFVPNSEGSAGDFLHPNRAGYQAIGLVGASAVLDLLK